MEVYYFTVFAFFSFALGSCIASFLNVCIWRWPRDESVVSPPSHCPKCGAPIRWYQNIPILSWCALRGRCANCREPISARYVIVELLGGILFLLAYLQWAMPSPLFFRELPLFGLLPLAHLGTVLVHWLVFAGLILGAFVDLDTQYLPDLVTIGGMVAGVPLSFLVPELQGEQDRLTALWWSLGGMAGSSLFLWGLGWIASKILKREAMGLGDVFLLGAVGAFFGPLAAAFTLVVSSFVGGAGGLVMILCRKVKLGGCTPIPYGPYLAIGTVVWMFWGPRIVGWYLRLNGFVS